MFISRFQINNYKCYLTPPPLELTPGINIITGQNDAGKTALLEALSLRFHLIPHLSPKTVPNPMCKAIAESSAVVDLTVSRQELIELLVTQFPRFNVPFDSRVPTFTSTSERDQYFHTFLNELFARNSFTISIKRSMREDSEIWQLVRYPSFGLYEGHKPEGRQGKSDFIHCQIDSRTGEVRHIEMGEARLRDCDFGFQIAPHLAGRVYSFKAERFIEPTSPFGTSRILTPNASNLSEVLGMLQSNPSRFAEYNQSVRQVLPGVKWVSVQPLSDRNQRILIWKFDPAEKVEHLTFSLDQCGTGVGQILAMLYVVLNSEYPRTIIIDEPQSFLHPGAIRKLIEILKQNPQHQYIIATHSPTIITAAAPETITVVRQEDAESSYQRIDATEARQLSFYLADIGARLSDVFGADNILWVEGQTEEICYPKIIRELCERSLMGIAVVGVLHTSDLERKDLEKVIEIYRRLSGANALLPPALGFLFDREDRPKNKRDDLERIPHIRIRFIPRRVYENYLLNPRAIAAVINDLRDLSAPPIIEAEVSSWLDNKREENKYGRPIDPGETWINYVRGDLILEDMFSDFLGPLMPFSKTTHSVALTEWLIQHSPADLQEIRDSLLYFLA